MKKLLSLVLGVVAFAAYAEMPHLDLTAGMYRIDAEVAADQQNRMVGLMNRRNMPANQGMLFVFPQDNTHCMWMRNTLIPLSVAFIDRDGVIINIEDMQPHTQTTHAAAKPAKYALEANQGWFRKRGIKPGDKVEGIEKSGPAR